jgi:ribosomal protein S18 acetylase RimI-like enzyme
MSKIRFCTEEDFDAVLILLGELWPGRQLDVAALRGVFHRALVSETQFYLCADDEGAVAGFCSLTLKNNLWQAGYLAHIGELVVDVRRRQKGIGRALLAAAIELAAGRDCARIELDSAFHREGAHRFYESQGFENRAYLFSKSLRDVSPAGSQLFHPCKN